MGPYQIQNYNSPILIIAPESFPPTTGESIVTSKLLLSLYKVNISFIAIHNPGGLHLYPKQETDLFSSIVPYLISPEQGQYRMFKKITKFRQMIWCIQAIRIGVKIIRKKHPWLIFSRAMPIYGHLPALILSTLTSVPWVANWSDPVPLSVSLPPFRTKTPFVDLPKKYCRLVARRAHLHSFPNTLLADYMIREYPEMALKSIIIPHIAYSPLFRNTQPGKSVFSICHSGGLGLRSAKPFLSAFCKHLLQHPSHKIRLTFIGPFDPECHKLVEQFSLDNIVNFMPALPYLEALDIMNNHDVSLLIEADTEMGIFLPSKVMDMIQLGKPILAVSPRKGVMADLLSGKKGGISTDINDTDQICSAIDELYSAWQESTLIERYGSICHRETFCEEAIINRFLEGISHLNNSESK